MSKKICGIYCIENLINRKKYIGKTVDFKKRVGTHLWNLEKQSHDNEHLQSSFSEYGKDNFVFYMIQELGRNQESLDLMEIYWIVYYESFLREKGYNMTMGGGGTLGKECSMETRELISKRNTGKIVSMETRLKKIGKKASPETRFKMSQKRASIETRMKISLAGMGRTSPNKGKSMKDEIKEKISLSLKGKQRGKIKAGTNKYIGVSKIPNSKKWISRITWNGVRIVIGRFYSEIEAAEAYNKKALEVFGDSAILNIIDMEES